MIRKAEQRDIPKITNLLHQVYLVHHNGRPDIFGGADAKYTEDELEKIIDDEKSPVFVFEEDGKILAHAFCNIKEQNNSRVLNDIKTLYIDDICVDESARGKHIGKALYDYVIDFAKEINCYNVTLNVWECNQGAKKFYQSMGMKVQRTEMEKIL